MKDKILDHYLQQNLKSLVICLVSTCRPTESVMERQSILSLKTSITNTALRCCRLSNWPHAAESLLKTEVPRLVTKFPTFYRTRRFISVFTRARHLSLSWARWIQSPPSHPVYLKFLRKISSFRRSVNEIFFFWDVTPCLLVVSNRSFGATYRSHLQGSTRL
jgi:hypothetical protein